MSKFKIGDRVKVVEASLFSPRNKGKEGVVVGDGWGNDVPVRVRPRVRFDDGSEDWGYDSDLELITPRGGFQFKVGDRVKAVGVAYGSTHSSYIGREGVIATLDTETTCNVPYRVKFGNGSSVWFKRDAVGAVTADTTSLDGKTYTVKVNGDGSLTLTPVVEKVAEEVKREPQIGEVWKTVEGALFLIARNYTSALKGKLYPVILKGNGAGIPGEESVNIRLLRNGSLTFAYESLSAAAADGALG